MEDKNYIPNFNNSSFQKSTSYNNSNVAYDSINSKRTLSSESTNNLLIGNLKKKKQKLVALKNFKKLMKC